MTATGPKGKRCGCRDENGKPLGSRCPDLRKRHHGSCLAEFRIDTSKGKQKLSRFGFGTAADRDDFKSKAQELQRLTGDDVGTRARIGDLIFERTRFGESCPRPPTYGGAWRSAPTPTAAARRSGRRGKRG